MFTVWVISFLLFHHQFNNFFLCFFPFLFIYFLFYAFYLPLFRTYHFLFLSQKRRRRKKKVFFLLFIFSHLYNLKLYRKEKALCCFSAEFNAGTIIIGFVSKRNNESVGWNEVTPTYTLTVPVTSIKWPSTSTSEKKKECSFFYPNQKRRKKKTKKQNVIFFFFLITFVGKQLNRKIQEMNEEKKVR